MILPNWVEWALELAEVTLAGVTVSILMRALRHRLSKKK
jgi:hypothetical protein